MLQVARLAPTLLQSSADLVGAFYRERYTSVGLFEARVYDGGVDGNAGTSSGPRKRAAVGE